MAVLGAGLIGSQAGHLIAYQVRFGAAAQQLQSSGAHAYFPTTLRAGFGVAAILVLAAGFVIGLARVLSGRSIQRSSSPPYLRLVAVLYTIQLGMFATPIMWTVSALGDSKIVAEVNPVYHLIEITRAPLLGMAPEPRSWLIACGLAVVGSVLALALMVRASRRIVFWL